MTRLIASPHRPIPIQAWLHHHERIAFGALGFVLAVLILSAAMVAQSMLEAALARGAVIAAREAAAVPDVQLPRKWMYESPETIGFDHMFRRTAPPGTAPNAYLIDRSKPPYVPRAD